MKTQNEFIKIYPLPIGKAVTGKVAHISRWGGVLVLSNLGKLHSTKVSGRAVRIIERTCMAKQLSKEELKAFHSLGVITGTELREAKKAIENNSRTEQKTEHIKAISFAANKLNIPKNVISQMLKEAKVI